MRPPMLLRTTSGRWSAWKVLLVAAALAVAVALSVTQGLQERVGQDFHVFWQAGRNFASGDPLYHGYLPGARPLKYPPFAAMVFQLLAPFSLQVAGAICSFLNLVLWVAAAYLTREIVARTFPNRRRSPLPLLLAVVFSAQFFLDNFHHVQMNEVIFVLVLLGIHAYLRGKDVAAAGWLVAATAIKLTPIFFVAWLVIRGRRRAALAVPPLALACVVLPLLVRGPASGAAELVEYYHTFLEGHQHGGIRDYTGGQNLAAFVNRMTQPSVSAQGITYGYFPVSDQTAQLAYQALWATVFLILITKLVLLRVRGVPVSAFELAMIFLAGLLLSPITFTTHLVSLLFVYYVFLSIRLVSPSPPVRIAAALLFVAMAVTGLSGRDLAGSTAYEAIGGYSVYVWTMLLLFLAAVALAGREVLGPRAGAFATVTALNILACTASRPAPASQAAPVAGSTVYACADNIRFSVRSIGDALVLALPEGADTLHHVEAASGAKYAGRSVVFWSKGEEASLEVGGARHTGCQGRRAGDPWEEAALMGVEFRAVGQEPGWVLDLVDGRWVRYIGDYGATRVYAPSPRQVRGAPPGTVAYDAEPEGRNLRVEIREQPCRDAMSGASFSHAVTVRLDGRAVDGCGRMTPPGELTNTYWKLTELDGQPVVVGNAREPHLRLRNDSRADGSTGCNGFGGTYERAGDRLTFGRLVTTLMACTDPALSRQEQRFLQILASVDRAAAVGDRLTLYAKDRPVARLVAVYFQ